MAAEAQSIERIVCVLLLLFALGISVEEPRQEIEVDVENMVEMEETNDGVEGRRSSERGTSRIEEESCWNGGAD